VTEDKTQNQSVPQQNAQSAQPKDPSQMSFDELLKGSAQPQWNAPTNAANQWGPQSAPQQQQQYWQYGAPQQQWPQQQWGQQFQANVQQYSANGQQQFSNQFIHNPYIGYAPHNQLHAAHNLQPSSNNFGYF
jgi:hypothetical protein